MSIPTYGEELFERHLKFQGIAFGREPEIPGITQRVDFVVEHPDCGKILLEVKDIESELTLEFGFADFYQPIRSHIQAGRKKFKKTADYICALVLAAQPPSFVMLEDPMIIMGAMYGDYGFRIPVDTERGAGDPDRLEPIYIPDKGKMIRRREVVRNTRIAALITVTEQKLWYHAMRKHLHTDDGRTMKERYSDLWNGEANMPDTDATMPGVTAWENAVATRKLPKNLFRGEMDAWWEVTDDGRQIPAFIGDRRRQLEIDKAALERLGMSL